MRTLAFAGALTLAAATAAFAAESVGTAPPPAPFQKVSKLVKLPDFLPGIGDLYVDPATLPAGPFLAYDRDGKIVSTIYMVPIEDLEAKKPFDNLPAPGGAVDHTDIYFNAGHPGVEKPHIHVVLWHVPAADEARVAK
ncbi:MAG: DUF5602 domain-containing protein [Bauldia sp.]